MRIVCGQLSKNWAIWYKKQVGKIIHFFI